MSEMQGLEPHPASVAGWSTADGPSRVVLRVEHPNGAVQEFTAVKPVGYSMALEASRSPAAGNAAGAGHREPAIMVTFSGNPAEGGIQVRQEGTPP